MAEFQSSLHLTSPEETSALARRVGLELGGGDVLLLEGEIGAGKTHFARSLIQSLLEVPEDIPSPTFTLVQTYDGPGFEIWHADLYRLTSPDEVIELGLTDAFEDSVCLIEWPDRLEDLTPENALHLSFTMSPEKGRRTLQLSANNRRWAPLIESFFND